MTFTVVTSDVDLIMQGFQELSRYGVKRAFRRAGRDIKPELIRLHAVASATWDQRVVPRVTIRATGGNLRITSKVNDELFSLLTIGARPHKIFPVNAPVLVFPWGGPGSYIPKTSPGKLQSSAGSGRFTGPIVYRMFVNHPGFPGREYHELIAKEILPFARKALVREIRREVARL